MKRIFVWMILGICSLSLSVFASEPGKKALKANAPMGSALRAIQEMDEMVKSFRTGSHLTQKDKDFNAALKHKIISGTFDIRELARLAMGPHWKEHTEAEQEHLVNLMVSLIEEKALFSKEQSAARSKEGGEYRVVYKGEKPINKDGTRMMVRTVVLVPAEHIDVPINYRLKRQNQDWKVYDIIVDEASLVDNYRYQFHSIISKYGYPELVSRIEKKYDEIKGKEQHETP